MLAALEEGRGVVPERLRRELAVKAFRHTASYDAAISEWLAAQEEGQAELFAGRKTLGLQREMVLRYGENPHQGGAVYSHRRRPRGVRRVPGPPGQGALLEQPAGRGRRAARWPACSPTRRKPRSSSSSTTTRAASAAGADLAEAYGRALADRSGVGLRLGDRPEPRRRTARSPRPWRTSSWRCCSPPASTPEARERFAAKKNLRLIECPLYRPAAGEVELRAMDGGFLAQPPDAYPDDPPRLDLPTKRQPTAEEHRALELAWKVVRYVKSNAIVVANARPDGGRSAPAR